MSETEFQAMGDDQRWREQPLPVTGLFLCYQQVRFVAEALAGALAQTVPMQLIVSDDGSSDGSTEVLVELLKDYRGPHHVQLRVGQKNLGLVPHFNRLMTRAEGELIVLFAGDDISYSHRVEQLVAAASSDASVLVFGSSFDVIAEHNSEADVKSPERPASPFDLRQYLDQSEFEWLPGATMAFMRSLLDRFGSLPESLYAEDIIILLRGLMLGRAQFLQTALLQYRVVSGSLARSGRLYGSDLRSVVESHRVPMRRVTGLAIALSADMEQVSGLPCPPAADMRRLRRRFLQPWYIEESLHRAVCFRPRRFWLWPALQALRIPKLRSCSRRLLFIALCPRLFFWLKAVRHSWARSRPAIDGEAR